MYLIDCVGNHSVNIPHKNSLTPSTPELQPCTVNKPARSSMRHTHHGGARWLPGSRRSRKSALRHASKRRGAPLPGCWGSSARGCSSSGDEKEKPFAVLLPTACEAVWCLGVGFIKDSRKPEIGIPGVVSFQLLLGAHRFGRFHHHHHCPT